MSRTKRERIDALSGPRAASRTWYRIENRATPAGVENAARAADLYVYDEIGMWGVDASRLVEDLRALDVDTLTVHINSPGGDAFDGVAIYNSLVQHSAEVLVSVEGMAASAASVIAMAGDMIVMQTGAMMMIHNASGMCWGESKDMRTLADLLDQVSASIASVYAKRAGGDEAHWLAAMADTTWYTASAAVEAGLADRVGAIEPEAETEIVETTDETEAPERTYHDTRSEDGRFAPAETEARARWADTLARWADTLLGQGTPIPEPVLPVDPPVSRETTMVDPLVGYLATVAAGTDPLLRALTCDDQDTNALLRQALGGVK